jgi:outer membrane lipoprotein-sorting protein
MLLVTALALVFQDSAAQQSLKKIGQALSNAKTVTIKFTMEAVGKAGTLDIKNTLSGTMLLKGGNKVLLSAKGTVAGLEDLTKLVSDGTTLKCWRDGREVIELKVEESLGRRTAIGFARGGMGLIAEVLPLGKDPLRQDDLDGLYRIWDLKSGADEGVAKTLTYALKTHNENELSNQVRLWYDPTTYQVLKRSIAQKGKYAGGIITETYEVTLDIEIPDDKFQVAPFNPAQPGQPTVKSPRSPRTPSTVIVDPWSGKKPGTWYRIKSTGSGEETLTDWGLKGQEGSFTLLRTQHSKMGQLGAVEEPRIEAITVKIAGQSTLKIQGRDYVCDIQEHPTGEKNWVVKEGRHVGAILKGESAQGVLVANKVWEHTLKIKGQEFECLVVEADFKGKEKTFAVKTWFYSGVPMGMMKIERDGELSEVIDFGQDWSKRPPFPTGTEIPK